MKVETKRLPNCQVELIVEPDHQEVRKALDRAARKISRRYDVPGFRRGKAPYLAVARAFGREVVYEQVAEDLGQKAYEQGLREAGIEPIAPGTLTEVTYDPLRFRFQVPLAPEVDLGDYRSLRVERPQAEVSDEEVDEQLRRLQESQAEWVPVEEGGAQYGDLITMRLVGKTADETIVDEEAMELELQEDNETFPPGFDQQFVGQQAGATLAFDLAYPEDWPTKRAGKKAHFEAEILSVKRYEVPPLDDDFAALIGDYDTLDELKESIRQTLFDQRQAELDNEYANEVLTKVIENAVKIEYPPVMVEEMMDSLQKDQEREMQRMGFPLEEYLRVTGKDKGSYREEFRSTAEMHVKAQLVLNELTKLEGLEATEDEIQQRIQELLASGSDNQKELRSWLASEDGRLTVKLDVERQKAVQRLIEIAQGTVPPLPQTKEVEVSSPEAVAEQAEATVTTPAEAAAEQVEEIEESAPKAPVEQTEEPEATPTVTVAQQVENAQPEVAGES